MMNNIFKRENTTISILGTDYKIQFMSYDEDSEFGSRNAAALCNCMTKTVRCLNFL